MTDDDIEAVVEMAAQFHAESGQAGRFVPDAFRMFVGQMAETGFVMRTERGFIGGVLAPSYCDPEWIMAVEFFWWARDGQGMHLLGAFEDWAKASGANEIRITTQETFKRAQAPLFRKGYKPMETSFTLCL